MWNGPVTIEQFFISVERKAFRMAEIATGGSDDSFDLVQDTMLKMVRHYQSKPPDQWKTLFYRILQNCIRDWYRRQKVRYRLQKWFGIGKEDDPIETIADTSGRKPDENVHFDDARKALDNALGQLPQRQQQAFLLRAWEELSVEETAKAMGCSAGSVKTHYSRAVHSLREILGDLWP